MPVADLVGSLAQTGASIYATNAQSDAAKNALDYQKQIRTDITPYMTAGTGALGRISDPNALAKNFMASPGYNWALQQGQQGVLQNSASNGLLRSGGAMKALDSYTTGAASQEFNNWFGQQESIANMGLKGEGIAAGVADNSSNIAMNAGANAGNSAIGIGNNIGNLAGSLSSLFGGKGGGFTSSYGATAGSAAGSLAGSMWGG